MSETVPDEPLRHISPLFSGMAKAVGSCYTTESIGRALQCSDDEVAAQVEDLRLLALSTDDGHLVFPAFQLCGGHIAPGLTPVLNALREGIDDPWAWALWLNSTPPVVEGIAPGVSRIQRLIDGEFDRVLRAAERTASLWRW